MRTYKFRLFTNENQERELARTLETHRRLYNAALDGKMLCWENGARWSFVEQSAWFTIQRRINTHYANLNATSGHQTLRKLDKAYIAFFKRCKAGKVTGHPRFKGRDRFDSFTFDVGRDWDGCGIVGRKLRLQHIGTIRVRWHRELPRDGKIKTVTIKRQAGKWFACFAVELPSIVATPPATHIGIDVGLTSFVTTSDGESLGDSRSLERALPELRRRQRALSRCVRGSNRRKIVKAGVAKLHAKVKHVRQDMHHQVARSLVDRYGVIAAESLRINNMLGNRRLSRRIGDAGWGLFLLILTSKAESAGCKVTLVDPKNTSQECSQCGTLVRKSLAVRVHKCPECGCTLDRDVNAARNILARTEPQGANVNASLHCPKSRFQLRLLVE